MNIKLVTSLVNCRTITVGTQQKQQIICSRMKTQTSLGIRSVCADSSFSAWRSNWYPATHRTPSKDSDQPATYVNSFFRLFDLRKLILQTGMRSYPVGLDVWFLVGPFVYFHTTCVRTVKALARLHECAGSPEPSLVAYVISTIISWAGANTVIQIQ